VGPYSVEAHAGGSEARMPFGGRVALRMGVRRLGLESSRLEPHEGGVREAYRPKRPPAFARAKEYIRIL